MTVDPMLVRVIIGLGLVVVGFGLMIVSKWFSPTVFWVGLWIVVGTVTASVVGGAIAALLL